MRCCNFWLIRENTFVHRKINRTYVVSKLSRKYQLVIGKCNSNMKCMRLKLTGPPFTSRSVLIGHGIRRTCEWLTHAHKSNLKCIVLRRKRMCINIQHSNVIKNSVKTYIKIIRPPSSRLLSVYFYVPS